MKPEVSIIIPAYNSEAYIAQAIESVLAQTYSNFEIILIDDASQDSTVKIARSFGDERIRIICNQQNQGVSYSRNCGIQAARGKWIALLDSDDWYAPQRLENLLLVAEKEQADLVGDNLNLIRDRESQPWGTLLQENEREIAAVEIIDAVKFAIADRPNPINAKRNWSLGYTKPLMRKEFLIDRGINYDEAIDVGEDFVLYLECLRQKARFVLVPQAYYYYRTRDNSLSHRKPTEYLAESCDLVNIFIERENQDGVNSLLKQVLQENLVIYRERLAFYQVLEAIKQKQIVTSITSIVDHPHILNILVTKLVRVALRKLFGLLERDRFNNTKTVSFNVASIKE